MPYGDHDTTDNELISDALHANANWIETGNVFLSAAEAAERNLPRMVKHLEDANILLVRRLRVLAWRFANKTKSTGEPS